MLNSFKWNVKADYDLPCNQQIFVLQEQNLCDCIFVSFESVQTALIDDIPHNHICVLQHNIEIDSSSCKNVYGQQPKIVVLLLSRWQDEHPVHHI